MYHLLTLSSHCTDQCLLYPNNAAHYSVMQFFDDAMSYDAMWCDAMWCDAMWCGIMCCDATVYIICVMLWCNMCDAMRCMCDAMWAMWCDAMWCDAM